MTQAPTAARRLVPDEMKQKALDLCLHEVEGFAGLSAAKKTDIHGMVVRLLAAPASPLPGGGQLSKNLGELSAWQDKAEGLESDLRQAVLVAWKRGAEEWCRLNYPQWVEWLEACHTPAAPTGDA